MKTNYSYREAVKEDVLRYIRNYGLDFRFDPDDPDELREHLNDTLWTADDVTGNGSGSYTFSREVARDYLMGDPDAEDMIREMISEFDLDAKTIANHLFDWEYWDVSLRCYLLGQAIDEAIDELKDMN